MIIRNPSKIIIPKLSGRYYTEGYFTSTATSTAAFGQNISYYSILLPEDLNIAEIGFNQTTANAGITYKANLYDSDPATLLPKNKLLADQTITADAIGFKALTVNRFLKAGLYYFAAIRTGGSSPTVTTKANTLGAGTVLGLGAVTPLTAANLGTRLSAFTYANDLPNPATQDSPVTYINSGIPVLWYKII
jgi:hypothetical protein